MDYQCSSDRKVLDGQGFSAASVTQPKRLVSKRKLTRLGKVSSDWFYYF